MMAISTKYFGPTDHRGSRIKASCGAGSLVIPWDHSLDVEENHTKAAHSLISKLGWGPASDWAAGSTSTGFVFVRKDPYKIFTQTHNDTEQR